MSSNKQMLSLLCNKHRLFYNYKRPVAAYCYKKHSTKATANPKTDWNQVVTEAEKVVGHPMSFLNLRWLLNDEIANVASHLQKLVGSNHSFLKTAKNLIYNEQNNMQTWGLIVLLVAKAAGQVNQASEANTEEVLDRQRALAEVTEMIRTGHMVHRELVNFRKKDNMTLAESNDMIFGNKIALLSGDYLLGMSCMKMSYIKNHSISELISCALRDLSESAFIGRRDNQNNPLPSMPASGNRTNYAIKEWTLLNYLGSGSLLAKSCKCTFILAGHDEAMQDQVYEFGKHLALAWQASLDLVPFINKERDAPFNLSSAPVMFHVQYDPAILVEIDKGLESVDNVDYRRIFDIVTNGPGIELTKQLQREHSQSAMDILTTIFEESEARTALSNIVASIGDY